MKISGRSLNLVNTALSPGVGKIVPSSVSETPEALKGSLNGLAFSGQSLVKKLSAEAKKAFAYLCKFSKKENMSNLTELEMLGFVNNSENSFEKLLKDLTIESPFTKKGSDHLLAIYDNVISVSKEKGFTNSVFDVENLEARKKSVCSIMNKKN